MGYIYCVRNRLTNEKYIGQSIQHDVIKRWTAHKNKNSNCIYLKRAFEKYGIENFEFKVLIICFDEDVFKFEIDYIKKYNTLVPSGYNISSGGEYGFTGCKHSEATKAHLSKCSRTSILKQETFKKISESVLKSLQNLDISDKMHKSESWNNAVLENRVGGNKKNTPIIQYDIDDNLIARYQCINEAYKQTNVSRSSILRALNGKQITAGGFKWLKDIENDDIKKTNTQSRTIIQYDLNNVKLKEYFSISDAVKQTNIPITAIINNLKNRNKSAHGFIWKYKDDSDIIQNNKKTKIAQYDLQDNQIAVFKSIGEAARNSTCSKAAIINVLKGRSKQTRNIVWKYVD